MRVVYFGTSEFAVAPLISIHKNVQLVVTQPDRVSGRGNQLKPSPVKKAAMELGICVETPERAKSEGFVELVSKLHPEALIVASYGQILSEKLLNAARFGGINLHASILPKYRGAAPVQRAILNGETETGVTLMQMDKGMDTGDIIAVKSLGIGSDETEQELEKRLSDVAANLIVEWLDRICVGDYPRMAQDHDNATYASKVEKAEGQLRFDENANHAYNRFRAFCARPGAYMETRFGKVVVKEAGSGEKLGKPSEVLGIRDDALIVGFVGGSLELKMVVPSGRNRMTGREFANGYRVQIGTFLADL